MPLTSFLSLPCLFFHSSVSSDSCCQSFFFSTGSHPSKSSVWSKFKLLNLATIIKQRSHILLTALVLLVLLISVCFFGLWGWGRAFCYISETTIQTLQLVKEYKSIFTWKLWTKIYDGWTPHNHQHSTLPKTYCAQQYSSHSMNWLFCINKKMPWHFSSQHLNYLAVNLWHGCAASILQSAVVSALVINWRYRK